MNLLRKMLWGITGVYAFIFSLLIISSMYNEYIVNINYYGEGLFEVFLSLIIVFFLIGEYIILLSERLKT